MVQQNTTGNLLAAGSLASLMAASLPKDAEPQLKGPYDAVALAVHAGMVAVGFKLKGLGEEHRIGTTAPTSQVTRQETNGGGKTELTSEASEPEPLPSEWNAQSSYAFRYGHPQSAMDFVIKIGRLGNKAVVDGIALGADKRTSFDISVSDYLSPSSLPATPLTSDGSLETAQQKLQDIFISPARLTDLGVLIKLHIIQKLAPSIEKEGYQEEPSGETTTQRRSSPRPGRAFEPPGRHDPEPGRPNPYPFIDPLAAPRRPLPPDLEPPGFDDEYDILRAPGRPGRPGVHPPFGIGHDDLYPPGLGPHDPLRPSFGPGAGSGGMHPTFDDPLFGGVGNPRGRGSGDSQVPPGARYDPVAPGDPRAGMRFPGAGHRGPLGGPPNPFGGFGGGDFI